MMMMMKMMISRVALLEMGMWEASKKCTLDLASLISQEFWYSSLSLSLNLKMHNHLEINFLLHLQTYCTFLFQSLYILYHIYLFNNTVSNLDYVALNC
jgi:hypothetical protein